MELQRGGKHLFNRGVDAVFFLVAGADAERAFGEVAAAAQSGFFFENDGFDALVNRRLCRSKAGKTAAHDDEIRRQLLGSKGREGKRRSKCGCDGATE